MILQITGDETPALQAVLDADVWRKHLLAEQVVSALLSCSSHCELQLCILNFWHLIYANSTTENF